MFALCLALSAFSSGKNSILLPPTVAHRVPAVNPARFPLRHTVSSAASVGDGGRWVLPPPNNPVAFPFKTSFTCSRSTLLKVLHLQPSQSCRVCPHLVHLHNDHE